MNADRVRSVIRLKRMCRDASKDYAILYELPTASANDTRSGMAESVEESEGDPLFVPTMRRKSA